MSRRHTPRAVLDQAAIDESLQDQGPTPADLAASIRASITTITKAWPHLENPPRPIGTTSRSKPGWRPPTPLDPLSLRVEILTDLAFWCHALLDDHPQGRTPDHPLDLTNAPAMLTHLHNEATWAGGWTHGNRLACELDDHARDARNLAWPRTGDGILLGTCPVTIGVDGGPTPCEGRIRAKATTTGDIACPRCKTKDTIDGWLLRIVGTDQPVTLTQAVPIVRRRLGVTLDRRTLQRWAKEGRLIPVAGTDGKPLFDRRHILTVVAAWDETRAGRRVG